MTGARGPAPKPQDRRARRNKDPIPVRTFEIVPAEPYALPRDLLPHGEDWHPATVRWWNRWCRSPLATELPEVDWSELEVVAVLHHQFMKRRSVMVASEMRQRMSSFGATPIDRARLRYQVASADEKEAAAKKSAATPEQSGKKRFGELKIV